MTTVRDVVCGDGKSAQAFTDTEIDALVASAALHYHHSNTLVPRLLATIRLIERPRVVATVALPIRPAEES